MFERLKSKGLERGSTNNSHETHDMSDIWKKLLEYGIKPVDEDGKITEYSKYTPQQLEKLLEDLEIKNEKAAA